MSIRYFQISHPYMYREYGWEWIPQTIKWNKLKNWYFEFFDTFQKGNLVPHMDHFMFSFFVLVFCFFFARNLKPHTVGYQGKSCMSGILIYRYIQLWHAISSISYCFQLDKIICIFRTISLILMRFSAKQNSLIALLNKLQI